MQVSSPTENPSAKSGPINGAVSAVATTAHDVVDKAAGAAGSAVQKANTAIDRAAETGHQAVSNFEKTVAPAERWIDAKTSAVLAAPKNAVADARQYIVTHPWQSVGLALFAGVLLGRRTG